MSTEKVNPYTWEEHPVTGVRWFKGPGLDSQGDPQVFAVDTCRMLLAAYEAGKKAKAEEIRKAIGVQWTAQAPRHVCEREWQEKKDRESENANHPCDDWRSADCMCRGACSCHWECLRTA